MISNDFIFDWCPELQRLYSSDRMIGRTGKVFENLGSLSTRRNIYFIRRIMMDYKPMRTLEVGLAFGASALAFAACHKERGNSTLGDHTAIDPVQTSDWDNVANCQLERAGLSGLVRTIELPSAIALAQLLSSRCEKFDLIYIDGSHYFEDVFVDFYFSSRLLNLGGIVLFDDCADPNVAAVLRIIRRNYVDSFVSLSLERYLEAPLERIRRRLAVLAGRVQMRAFRKLRDTPASLEFFRFLAGAQTCSQKQTKCA